MDDIKYYHISSTDFNPGEVINNSFKTDLLSLKLMLRRWLSKEMSVNSWAAAQVEVEAMLEALRPSNQLSRIGATFGFVLHSKHEEAGLKKYAEKKGLLMYEVQPIGKYGLHSSDVLNIMVCWIVDKAKPGTKDFDKYCKMYWAGKYDHESDGYEIIANSFHVLRKI